MLFDQVQNVVYMANDAMKNNDPLTALYLKRAAKRILNGAFDRPLADGAPISQQVVAISPLTRLTVNEVQIGEQQGKIACIKEVRSRTGLGLKEAKDAVEYHFDTYNRKFKF